MSKGKSESQIVALLNQAEASMPTGEICRNHGIAQSSFYKWRSKYGGMHLSEVKRLKEVEEELRRLK